MSDDQEAFFFHDGDPGATEPACRHWMGAGACAEVCACGHGCGEHHDAGWCGRCKCLGWADGPEQLAMPDERPQEDDDWELADVFADEQEEYDDASGF